MGEAEEVEVKRDEVSAWPACAIVLAGGSSRRMGTDKSMLLCDGVPIIERLVRRLAPYFDAMLLSTNQPETHAFLGVPMVADTVADAGPMGGILSALECFGYDANFVIACDIIDPPHELIAELHMRLNGHDAALPWVTGEDRFEPLCGWYNRRIAVDMRGAIDASAYKLQDFLRTHDVATLPIADGSLTNLNTPADAKRHLK